MGLNFEVFQEPRGVMRVIQFIFAIWAFAITVDYSNEITINTCTDTQPYSTKVQFYYPYQLDRLHVTLEPCSEKGQSIQFPLAGDFSSDAQFFVATGVLSMLYTVGVSVLYVVFSTSYEANPLVPMADFIVTLILAVFWLSGSAAWANGIVGLKSITSTDSTLWDVCSKLNCAASVGSFSGLNISVTLGFLNFFLWAFDLWFLYKETQWFKDADKKAVPANLGVSAA